MISCIEYWKPEYYGLQEAKLAEKKKKMSLLLSSYIFRTKQLILFSNEKSVSKF